MARSRPRTLYHISYSQFLAVWPLLMSVRDWRANTCDNCVPGWESHRFPVETAMGLIEEMLKGSERGEDLTEAFLRGWAPGLWVHSSFS